MHSNVGYFEGKYATLLALAKRMQSRVVKTLGVIIQYWNVCHVSITCFPNNYLVSIKLDIIVGEYLDSSIFMRWELLVIILYNYEVFFLILFYSYFSFNFFYTLSLPFQIYKKTLVKTVSCQIEYILTSKLIHIIRYSELVKYQEPKSLAEFLEMKYYYY